MKTQINIALILVFLLIIWLFINSSRDEFELGSMDIGTGSLPLVMNKRTGETWRYFINNDKDKTEFGFTPLGYYWDDKTIGVTPQQIHDMVSSSGK